jgi:hypothetical protein
MRLSIRLNNDAAYGAGAPAGTQQVTTITEADAKNLRIEDGSLAYDVKGKTRTVSLRELRDWQIDGGRRQFVGDGTTDGPVFPA